MKRLRLAPAVTLAMLLCACGGGGGGANSTPPPPPPPPPPPTSANADLIDLGKTESFTNDASLVKATFAKSDGSSKASGSPASLTIVYDASAKSYALTGGGIGQTFVPADITSNTSATIFVRKSGSTTDQLVLTKPGTSGPLTYRYVGGGTWQRIVDGVSSVTANTLAFTYGVETLDSAMPKTGTAGYAVDLIGSSGLTGYYGQGSLTADFLSSSFLVNIAVGEVLDGGTVTPPGLEFKGSGSIGSTNKITGTFSLNAFQLFNGSINGRFYGPSANEVGATFYGAGGTDYAINGYFIGRQDASAPTSNTTITNLAVDQTFTATSMSGYYATHISNGSYSDGTTPGITGGSVKYTAADKSFVVSNLSETSDPFLDSQKSISSDGRYVIYDQGNGSRLLLYRPGGSNTQLALTYASYAIWERTFDEPGFDRHVRRLVYLPWGVNTQNMPVTGTASYDGILDGYGIGDTSAYTLGGTAALTANFGNGSLSGSLSPVGTNVSTGTVTNFGNFDFTASMNGANFAGNIPSSVSIVPGIIEGGFFGPEAAELAGTFRMVRAADPINSASWIELQGVVVGKKH